MGPISIVNLEQRTNAIKELEKLKEFIQTELFYQPLLYKPRENLTFLKFIKKHILELPFSKTANTFEQYCEEIGVNLNPQSEKEATKSILYVTNFIMNTITAILCDSRGPLPTIESIASYVRSEIKYTVYHSRIERLLELFNYKQELGHYDRENDFHEIIFTKRDADVDSVLPIVTPDTRIDLLSYLDFRLENNLIEKQTILKRLAAYLEPKRKEYESFNKGLTSSIFYLFNNINIRHNNTQQVTFESEAEQIEYYDICFKMILHLIREKEVSGYIEKVSALQKK